MKKYFQFLQKVLKKIQGYVSCGKVRCLELVIFAPGRCRLVLYILFLVVYTVFNQSIQISQMEGLDAPEGESAGSNSSNSEKSFKEKKFGWEGAAWFAVSALAVLISQASAFGGGGGEDAFLGSGIDLLVDFFYNYFSGSNVTFLELETTLQSNYSILQSRIILGEDANSLLDSTISFLNDFHDYLTLKGSQNVSKNITAEQEDYLFHLAEFFNSSPHAEIVDNLVLKIIDILDK